MSSSEKSAGILPGRAGCVVASRSPHPNSTDLPAQIVDPDSVPPSVTKERPPGKKATCYCVQFFPKGD